MKSNIINCLLFLPLIASLTSCSDKNPKPEDATSTYKESYQFYSEKDQCDTERQVFSFSTKEKVKEQLCNTLQHHSKNRKLLHK